MGAKKQSKVKNSSRLQGSQYDEETPRINSFYAPKNQRSRVVAQNFGQERRVSDISGAEIDDGNGSQVMDFP